MDFSIASILLLDGVTNGAIYALLGLATVLVFTVTRIIFIPQGEFVAYGALTLAMLQTGKIPGTVWLLIILALVAALMEGVARWRHHAQSGIGGHHAAARAHQKGVTGKIPQAFKRRAHRRLVHAQADSCFGDAAFCKHGVKDPDQMKVYLVKKRVVCHT